MSVWTSDHSDTPLLTGPSATLQAEYGLGEISDRRNNLNPRTTPIFLSGEDASANFDIHERELTLKKRGDMRNGRLSSLNSILVPKGICSDWCKVMKYIYDTYSFGGSSMPGIKHSAPGTAQESQMTMIYGGEILYENLNPDKTLPAMTKLRWRIPFVDESGIPIKVQSASRSETFAPIILEPVPPVVSSIEKAWIFYAMNQYISTGRAGDLDQPLKEGSAHLLDATIAIACVYLETMMNVLNTDSAGTILQTMHDLVGHIQYNNIRNIGKKLTSQEKNHKRMLVNSAFFGSKTLKNKIPRKVEYDLKTSNKFQRGNAMVKYITSSRSINNFQDGITVGYTLNAIKPGDTGAVYIGKGYTGSGNL